MNASIPVQQAITAGSVVAKGSYYHLVMTWYEPVISESGEAKTRKRQNGFQPRYRLTNRKARRGLRICFCSSASRLTETGQTSQ